ncbi:MAG: hypothetical protein ACO3ZD_10295 [Cyanobium sp.]
MDSSIQSAFKGHLLLTLVDHAKPFKGTWQIYRQGETIYSACHAPAPSGAGDTSEAFCQAFTSNRQVCQFTELLQFYGWSVEGQSPDSLHFLQGCAL